MGMLAPVRVNPLLRHPAEQRQSLDGEWRFRLDPQDRGRAENWYRTAATLPERIRVPGCWQGQGFGGDGLDTLWDFGLKARVFRATYTGTGWYGRTFQLPAGWEGRRYWLNFGGAHPSAEVWLNGHLLGMNDLPFVPFGFEVTGLLRQGGDNDLVVRVDERQREFGLAFNWQGHWSGLYRGVDLTATGNCYLEHCALLPDVPTRTLRLRVRLGGDNLAAAGLTLAATVTPVGTTTVAATAEATVTGSFVEFSLPVKDAQLWSPDTPRLYRVDVTLRQGEAVLDAVSERTGFVQLTTAGKHLLINGEPYYFRGSGDFVSCPETGCPDTDRVRWRRKLQALRDYGYNYVRCQSYVYGPEYYDVADEVGLLVQSEMGLLGGWGGTSPWHVYQWPKPTADHYPVLRRHWNLVVARDVNHPSANLYCMSNEYGSPNFPRIAWRGCQETKAIKPTALVIWTDGGHSDTMPEDFVNWEADKDKDVAKPLIQHEFRWWSSFPDPRLAGRYTGAVRPYASDLATAAAAARGQAHLLTAYAEKSQRLQYLEAKGKLEAVRRDHPTLAGICHFNAMDANPSPQGVINEFYEHKYADAARWRATNGDTVVLASLGFADRVLTGGETFTCTLAVSDFAHPAFKAPTVEWRLTAGGTALAEGRLTYEHQAYRTCPIGELVVSLPPTDRPQALVLEAKLSEGERTVTNHWDLWLFPAASRLPTGVVRYGACANTWLKELSDVPVLDGKGLRKKGPAGRVVLTEALDEALAAFLEAGGRVILAAGEGLVRPHPWNFGYVKYFFTPPANYAPYEDGQNGTLIAAHPLLGDVPHEGFADLQFFRLMDDAPPLDLAPLELTADPVIRVIHRYPVLHPLGYLAEATCGKGRLILTALDLQPRFVEARYLLQQFCRYAAAKQLPPAPALSPTALERLLDAGALP